VRGSGAANFAHKFNQGDATPMQESKALASKWMSLIGQRNQVEDSSKAIATPAATETLREATVPWPGIR